MVKKEIQDINEFSFIRSQHIGCNGFSKSPWAADTDIFLVCCQHTVGIALVYRFHTSHVFTIHFQAVCSTEHACQTDLCIGMILKHIIPGGYRKLRNYKDCLFPP